VKVLNLFTDETYLVSEKDSRLIFRKNDIFQGRLIYFQQQFQFTGNFCFHPEKTHRYIKPEIKIISKTQTKNTKDLIKLDKQLIKENKKHRFRKQNSKTQSISCTIDKRKRTTG
jgi:uncharacterized membrane protein YgaE (UPF0421/DUF939 family)